MVVLLALDGEDSAEFVQQVAALVSLASRPLLLLYVVDPEPRQGIELARRRFPGRGPLPPPREAAMRAVETAHGAEVLAAGRAACLAHGVSEAQLALQQVEGRPEQAIVRVAAEARSNLIVVRARRPTRGGPRLGPPSVGHVARFVLDHAPCPVLLLRGG